MSAVRTACVIPVLSTSKGHVPPLRFDGGHGQGFIRFRLMRRVVAAGQNKAEGHNDPRQSGQEE